MQKLFKAYTRGQDGHLAFPLNNCVCPSKRLTDLFACSKHAGLNLLLRLSTNWLGAQSGDLSDASGACFS